MSPFAPPTPSANPALDGEHRVQVALINALCAVVEDRATGEEIGRILERLVDYSKAHFLSEELLMRLDSYDGFDQHVEDHADMLDALAALTMESLASRFARLPRTGPGWAPI
jgi:hemerythrin